ncbi:MAG: IS3 family transposase [Magnetococcus sp. WYHC-3]
MSRPQRLRMVERGNKVLSLCRQCSLLRVSRASACRERSFAETSFNRELMSLIDRPFLEMPYYDSRKMTECLCQEGYPVGRKRVQRLMRRLGLQAIYQKPNTSRPHPESIPTCCAA